MGRKGGKGRSGNEIPRTTPHTLSKASMGSKLFKEPKVFEVPKLSSIEILAKGKCAKVRNFYSSAQSGQASFTRFMRMVNRAPEVMVKVTGGGMSTGQIRAHLDYISRNGKLDLETDEGERLEDREDIAGFAEAWDVDARYGAGERRQAYNIMLSMPKGTDPEKVRQAARAFAQEQFSGKYPYAMVLHTDKAHPHVHICVRMTPNERQEKKLFIRRQTLESYRQHFADKLVERGVEAAATPREYRGVTQKGKKIAVYHAEKAGRSAVAKAKLQEVIKEVKTGIRAPEPWKERIANRRKVVLTHYQNAITELEAEGKHAQAAQVKEYVKKMPPLFTERDQYRKRIHSYMESKQREMKQPLPHQVQKPITPPDLERPQPTEQPGQFVKKRTPSNDHER